MRAKRPTGRPLLIIAAIGAIGSVAGGLAFGPDRAVRLAAAAAANVTADGLAEDPGPHHIRVVEVEVKDKDLDRLQANLPFSGTEWVEATLVDHGVRYPVEFRYRGFGAVHHVGNKRSFRLKMKRDGAFAPYKRLNFLNPKSLNMVNVDLAYWIAQRMGVATPFEDMVFVRLNGRDHGVMHLCEQVDGDYERNRHLGTEDVPVYKGDFPPTNVRVGLQRGPLWKSADNWEYLGDADSTEARRKLEGLVWAVNQRNLPWERRRDTLEKLIDVDAFLRFAAAIKVLDTRHIDNYHNQLLVLSPRSGRFYPVLWDPILLFAPKGEPFYVAHDALSYWLLRDPEWRWVRDRYIAEALATLHAGGAFARHMDEVLERIGPSVFADRNKYCTLTRASQDVDRYSVLHWALSAGQLRTQMNAYWDRLSEQVHAEDLRTDGDQRTAHVTGTAVPPLQITIEGDSLAWDTSTPGPDQRLQAFARDTATGALHFTWLPLTARADSGGAYREDQYYELPPWNMTLRMGTGRIRSVSARGYFNHGTKGTTH